MNKPIIVYLLILILLPTIDCTSQNIYYSYDNSGNRIFRTITVEGLKSASAIPDTGSTANSFNNNLEDKLTEDFENLKISIFPNPTSGIININIEGKEELVSKICLFDLNGKIIYSKYIYKNFKTIDLSNYAKGIYFLKIIADGEQSEWRIIIN